MSSDNKPLPEPMLTQIYGVVKPQSVNRSEIWRVFRCAGKQYQTHLPLDKMAAIWQTIFQMYFREWKVLYFDKNFIEICS